MINLAAFLKNLMSILLKFRVHRKWYQINFRNIIWKWPAKMRKNNFKASSKLNSLRSLKRRKLSDVNHIIILIAAIIVPLLGGCDPSGSVGGGLGGSETDIQYDTTTISQIHVDTLVAY